MPVLRRAHPESRDGGRLPADDRRGADGAGSALPRSAAARPALATSAGASSRQLPPSIASSRGRSRAAREPQRLRASGFGGGFAAAFAVAFAAPSGSTGAAHDPAITRLNMSSCFCSCCGSEFVQVQRQVERRNVVIAAHDAALDQRPKPSMLLVWIVPRTYSP